MYHLIVTRPFGAHARGDRVTDAKQIEEIEASENAHDVVRVTAAPEADPEPAKSPESKD